MVFDWKTHHDGDFEGKELRVDGAELFSISSPEECGMTIQKVN